MQRTCLVAAAALLAACSDRTPTAGTPPGPEPQRYDCVAAVRAASLSCGHAPGAARAVIVGSQNVYVRLTSSNVHFDAATGVFSAEVVVTNLLRQVMGTDDGATPDPNGIRVFFHTGPVATAGTGIVTVDNPDGRAAFTGADQPYFRYDGILMPGQSSPARSWRWRVDPGVEHFAFTLYVDTRLPPVLVITEIMAHPVTVSETEGEWFEVYNGGLGSVDLKGWTIASGGDDGHTIAGNVLVPGRGYVVLGRSTVPAANGSTPVTYAYTGVTLGNDTDDWLTLRSPAGVTADSVTWGAAAGEVAAPPDSGVTRSLEDPAAPNLYLGGASSRWTRGVVVYGALGERGTPGMRNPLPLSAVHISRAQQHTCAADPAGQAWCWGANDRGQLGVAGVTQSPAAVAAAQPAGARFTRVAALSTASCALTDAGQPLCWGDGFAWTPPSGLPSTVYSGLTGPFLACMADPVRDLYCWSVAWSTEVYRAEDWSAPVTQLSRGAYHSCALAGGRVYCWGENREGQIGNGRYGESFEFVPVTEALLPPGEFVAVVVTHESTCALSAAGQAFCWGSNYRGEMGSDYEVSSSPLPRAVLQPPGVRFTTITSGGLFHICGLTDGGQAWCWGGNSSGEVGNGATALRQPHPVPVLQPPRTRFSGIVAGTSGTCALESGTGQPFCWGWNAHGEVGDGTYTQRLTPVAVIR